MSVQVLRPYQEQAVAEIRNLFAAGKKKVMLILPTGAGKTAIFCYMAKQSLAREKRVMIVTRGKKIVQQASSRLTHENVPHGVMMGTHPMYAPSRIVQVCSISTLRSRQLRPKADFIVIDEAHFATAKEFHDLLEQYPRSYILGVTATPWTKKPLLHLAEHIVSPVSTQTIIDQGFLVDGKYFAPTTPDLKGVRIRGGDYVEEDLERVMTRGKIIGDTVESYQKFSNGLPALCFCVSIAHATQMVERFRASGIPAVLLHANTPDHIRDESIRELENGPLKVICNVGVMGVGVDIPWLRTVILARPTKSLNLHLQQIGRGSRPYPGKERFLVLDHANNCHEHGFMADVRELTLDGTQPKNESKVKTCSNCFAIFNKLLHPETCPACGKVWRELRERPGPGGIAKVNEVPGQLVEIGVKTKIPVDPAIFIEAHQRVDYHLDMITNMKKADGSPYSPWAAYYRAKTEMTGKIDEDALVRVFRARAKARGWSVG